MLKCVIKSQILSGSLNKFIIKSFRLNSSQFENLPLFKSEVSLERLYPKSESTSQTNTEVCTKLFICID